MDDFPRAAEPFCVPMTVHVKLARPVRLRTVGAQTTSTTARTREPRLRSPFLPGPKLRSSRAGPGICT